jgi:L-asparaginase
MKASIVCSEPAATPVRLVLLGMGGTIAGRSAQVSDNVGYRAGEVAVADLLDGLPLPADCVVEAEQVCQIDSKDLGPAHWQALVQALQRQLARAEVAGLVITHGTDTLEETAYLLHRVLAPTKPVVLTAAMRPATALSADGPRNLVDALLVAAEAARLGRAGVVAVLAGRVWAGAEVRKVHSHRLDAFDAGDAGPLALVEEGRLRELRAWPAGDGLGSNRLALPAAQWPQVEIVLSHAGANGRLVKLLMTSGVDGLVVAGTGNGTLHAELEAALIKAERAGIRVLRSTRCAAGGVIEAHAASVSASASALASARGEPGDAGVLAGAAPHKLRSAGPHTPLQARIDLLLELLARRQPASTHLR